MKALKYILFTVVALLVACEDTIDVDLNSVPPRVVIEAMIGRDSVAKVYLTQTADFNHQGAYPVVRGAQVTVSDDRGNFEVLQQNAEGWYMGTTLRGIASRTYSLSVVYDGTEYTAQSYMPPPVAIDSLTLYKTPLADYPFPMIHFKDPAGSENQYYRFFVYFNGRRDPEAQEYILPTEHIDGSPIHQLLFTDIYPYRTIIQVEMQCIDPAVYTFFETLNRNDMSLNNPTTNIRGGALGYFSAYSATLSPAVAGP